MTTLIKNGAALSPSIRPYSARRESAQQVRGEVAVLREQIATLTANLEAARRESAEISEELASAKDDAHAEGRAEGYEAGLSDAQTSHDEALERLRGGLEAALEAFRTEISSLEKLAPELARSCLEQIFSEPGRQKEMVRSILQDQLAALADHGQIEIEVSADDFSDPETLGALQSEFDRPGVSIRSSEHRGAGECSIRLRLGELVVGPRQQWSVMSDALRSMTQEDRS